MEKAYVTTNLLDLWTEPKFNSERASQLFFAESLEVGETQNGFSHVRQTDGYAGWADLRFLRALSIGDEQLLHRQSTYVVTVPSVKLVDKAGKSTVPPHQLFYGTIVKGRPSSQGFIKLAYPDLPEFYLRRSQVDKLILPVRHKPSGRTVAKEALKFLGVPYLWGGLTTTGADCSGMTRTLFSRFGFYLPRDTKDQITVGQEIPRDQIRVGDLLFFKRHVALALDNHRIIHSSMGSSGVRIQSLRDTDHDYRPDLDHDFALARRIL